MVLLGLIALVIFIVFLIKGIVSKIKKRPAKRDFLIAIIAVILFFVFVAVSPSDQSGKKNENKTAVTEDSKEQTSNSAKENDSTAVQEKNSLFDGDSSVNDLLNSYNTVNTEGKISAGEFEIYNHHGSAHKNQGITQNHDGYQIVVTDGNDVYLESVEGGIGLDEIKPEAVKWIKALYPNAQDDEIDAAWDSMVNDLIHDATIENDTFERLEIAATMSNDRVQYMKITKMKKYS